jgi:hypothetical protein
MFLHRLVGSYPPPPLKGKYIHEILRGQVRVHNGRIFNSKK